MTPFDARWYHRLLELTNYADTTWMQEHTRVSSRERERFFEHDVENPHLRYVETESLEKHIHALGELRNEVTQGERNLHVRKLYEDKIDAYITRFTMLDCTRAGDDMGFFTHSMDLYGKPKKSYFAYIARRMREMLHEMKPTVIQKKAHRRMLGIVSKINHTHEVTPTGLLPDIVHNRGNRISVEEVQRIFNETLIRYGIKGWTICVDETRRRFSVHQKRNVIYIPSRKSLNERRVPLTDLHARALAEHEIGVHVRRAYEGEKQPLMLLKTGLAGYLRGEEGIAGYMQQRIEGASEYYGFDRYLALSLACGLDGEVRDFRSVFSCMVDYYLLTLLMDDTIHTRVEQYAWDTCMRIFRGTSGQRAGVVFTRDIVYLEGNIGIWNMLFLHPERLSACLIGKYDPLNQSHVTSLQALGILPQW